MTRCKGSAGELRSENAKAVEAADADNKERLFLIGKDGINGPDIEQLRKETTANINGAGESHFNDPRFVKAAKEMHEARLLAEGGYTSSQIASVSNGMNAPKRNSSPALRSRPRNRKPRHRQRQQPFERPGPQNRENISESLEKTGANETQIRGRLAATRSEGTQPTAAVTKGKTAARPERATQGHQWALNGAKNGPQRQDQ